MKKISVLLLSILCVCCLVFAMTACTPENKPTDSSIQSDTTNSENSINQGQEPNSSSQGQTTNSSEEQATNSSEGQAPNSSEGQTPNSSSGGGDVPPTPKHEHKYGEWVNDETNHWKECTATEGECDTPKIDLAAHTFDSESGKCTVCKFQQPVTISYSEITENGKVVGYSVSDVAPKNITSVSIPAEYNGKPVTSIKESAFQKCNSLVSLTIPASITSIEDYAFDSCYRLVEVYNLSSIYIRKGSLSNGYVGYYALDVYTSLDTLSKLSTTNDSYVFYENGEEILLVAYLGTETNLVLPEKFNNKNYDINKYAFYGCDNLTNVTLPNGLTSIGNRAFYGCDNLTSVTISETVTSISYWAFAFCKSLKNINIPDSVTSIYSYAFEGCTSLLYNEYGNALYLGNSNNPYLCLIKAKDSSITSCETNSNTKFIHSDAFNKLANLTSVTIADSVTYIGSDAFENCPIETATIPSLAISSISNERLKTVTVTSGKKIGNSAFKGCVNLTSITLPNTITAIGEYAFDGCVSLTSITLPEGVTSIDDDAFKDCTNLISITLPKSLTSIGLSVCMSCIKLVEVYNLSSLNITKGSEDNGEIGYYALDVYTSLDTLSKLSTTSDGYIFYENGEEVYLMGYKGTETNLVLPEKFNDKNYTLYKYAFFKNTNLVSVTLPNGLTSIANCAFADCTNLVSVTLPNSLTSIGVSAFNGCTSLTSVTIPDSVTSIDAGAFHNCMDLKSVTIGNSVNSIGNSAFSDCFSLTSIIIPDSVTSVGNVAFENCENLTSVTIGSGVTSIGSFAFQSCQKLVEVYNFSSLNITKRAEGYGLVAYKALDVYTSKTDLSKLSTTSDGYIFYENGEEVYLMGYTGEETNLVLPQKFNNKNYALYKYAFYNDTEITSVTISEGVTSIGAFAFSHCTNIKSIVIPNSVTSIGNYAFYDCENLKSVTIGKGVTSIGEYAFNGCLKLESATFADTANWYVSNPSTPEQSVTLTDPSSNAVYLKETYYYCTWKKIQN